MLLAGFSATALALAALGLYGIVAFAVGQRSREIGLRVALGARPFDVARLVSPMASRRSRSGLGLGSVAAFLASRAIEAQFFGVSAADATTLGVRAGRRDRYRGAGVRRTRTAGAED